MSAGLGVVGATPAFFAMKFDGTTESANFGDRLNFNYTQPVTFAAWVKKASDAFNIVFARRMEHELRGWSFQVNSGGRFGCSFLRGSQGLVRYSGNVCPANQWHLIAISSSGTGATNSLSFYVDGASTASTHTDGPVSDPTTSSASLRIGAEDVSGGVTYRFAGLIGPCGVWDRVLTAGEVAELARMRVAVDWRNHSAAANLIWHPAIDGYADLTASASVKDRSVSGYDGTPIAMDSSNIVPVYPHELPVISV